MINNNSQKGFTTFVVIAAIIIIVAVGGYFISQKQLLKNSENQKPEDERAEEKENIVIKEDGAMIKYEGAILAGNSAPLLDFVKADYDTALKSDKLIILYFYANWCPICRKEFPEMQAVFDSLTANNVIGFRVNYNDNQTDDDEKSLAREFGIAYQHTKIFIKNGTRILKSPETWDKDRYFSEINNALN